MSNLVKTNIYRVLKPCSNCPFSDNGKKIDLVKGRVDSIKQDLLDGGHFTCHKTVYDLDINMNEANAGQTPKMCAGAYNFLKERDKPNEAMRLALKLGVET